MKETKKKNKKEYTIKTDRVNSKAISVKVGGFTLMLPPDSSIKVGEQIEIKPILHVKDNTISTIEDILIEAVKSCGDFDAILVSGGIDSSVLASIAKLLKKKCALIVVGFDKSEDIKYAEILGKNIGYGVSTVVICDEDVKRAAKELKILGLDTYNVILGIVEYLALEYAKEKGYRSVLSGLGSDELFFGFKKHRELEKEKLREFREGRLFYLPPTDLIRIRKISENVGISILMPYLKDSVVEYALNLNINGSVDILYNKSILRQVGKKLGLNEALSERNKKAMQYGSGVMKSLERLSKKNKIKNVGDFIKSI